MSRAGLAQAIGSASTWTLRNIFHRPAENFPGKAALLADPDFIGHLRLRVKEGVVAVVGTNGKTTVTNLLADAFEASGKTVACNRTGANLDSGVASALLHAKDADWGVFESDELWLPAIAPQLEPDFIVLLNLFRDQLDRAGEIDHVQQRIADALASSPETVLVYNADDPFCQAIADRCDNERIPFGISRSLGLPQNKVADSGLCQNCDGDLRYAWRQYGQLGSYRCPRCGFSRVDPTYRADDVKLEAQALSFTVHHEGDIGRVQANVSGAYMAYNLLAACVAADCCRIPFACVNRAIRAYSPGNGRLQAFRIGERRALLNLAKNPVGFNQNLRIVADAAGPKAVAFFVNDKEADGRDVSWLWDVDFEELAAFRDTAVYAGGTRRNDLQVRLKYAGIDARLVDGARDFVRQAQADNPEASYFLIANYTALPGVKTQLEEMSRSGLPAVRENNGDANAAYDPPLRSHASEAPSRTGAEPNGGQPSGRGKLTVVHLHPELLNLYGDGGNVSVLERRARARGIDVEVVRASRDEPADFEGADIVLLGGGPDREQRVASQSLLDRAEALRGYVEDDGVLLAICGGYQILGKTWLVGDEVMPGLGILDMETRRAEGGARNRIVGDIALDSPLAKTPVIGYENHAGRTFLGVGCEPFGHVIGGCGKGNNDRDGADGARYRNVVGTYLHGPLLAKNPEIADWLIERALARRSAKEGRAAPALAPLDDAAERAANTFMCAKHGIHGAG